jgi:hypothetical protein
MTLFEELRAVLSALDAAAVDHVLVGGLAVAVWGVPRATKDIDLLVRAEDLDRALAAVRAVGFTLEAFPFEFKDGTVLHRRNKVDAEGNLMTVDFMVVDKNLEPVWHDRLRVPFDGRELSIASREALIGMKARAARPEDLVDIQNLRDLDR